MFRSASLLVSVSSFSFLTNACNNNASQTAALKINSGKAYLNLDDPAYRTLHSPGNGVKITIGKAIKPILVTRVNDNEVAAFSSSCTHAGYNVLLPQKGILTCESGHGGSYDIRGNVLSPPPTSNLDKFNAVLQSKKIIIDLNNYI